MRYGQVVIGPAGSGKSTYCSGLVQHGLSTNRRIEVINLDPAAEFFDYDPLIDIRELINVTDAMEDPELHFGPNGALVFCLEYLLENFDWFRDKLDDLVGEDDYVLFDCPGQIELFTHLTSIKKLLVKLQNLNFNVCTVYLLDVQFMTDGAKFLSGTISALSVMVNLELPHVNLLSKMDLLSKQARKRLDEFLEPNSQLIVDNLRINPKYRKLSEAFGEIIENYSLVRFLPLNLRNEESVSDLLVTIDNVIQYGEDLDVKVQDFTPENDED